MRVRKAVIAAFALLVGAVLATRARIPQPPEYHAFADARTLLGVARACDVLSNAPFLVVGIYGLARMQVWRQRLSDRRERFAYALFFAGVLLTAAGSAYYHLAPTTERLFWDRMPMAVGFMSFFAAQIGERVEPRLSWLLLAPLMLLGLGSVIYWSASEHDLMGDLRPYIFVQGFPLVSLPVMLLFFPARYDDAKWLWITLGLYLLAKVLESADVHVWHATGERVSGHTLKHLAGGAATAMIAPMLLRRHALAAPA